MTRLADIFTRKAPPAVDTTPLAQARQPERQQRMAEALRGLLADYRNGAAAPLKNGHANGHAHAELTLSPLIEVATTLWTRVLRFDAADPAWADRDRVVIAQHEHGRLLRAVLELTGVEQAHLALGLPGLDPVFGPPGQALAFAVGSAIAERMMAARFGKSLVDHRTWVIATPADIAGGLSYEAASLAGVFKLAKLAIIVDDTPTQGHASSDEMLERFASWGWATKRVGAQDPAAISAAFTIALRARKPLLIACRKPQAAPLSALRPAERAIAEDLREAWRAAGARNTTARRGWLKRLARHAQVADFDRAINSRLPDGWRDIARAERMRLAETDEALSPLVAGHRFVEAMAAALPDLVGGAPSPQGKPATAPLQGAIPIDAGDYSGRHIAFGAAETALAGVVAGVCSHGGLTVVAETSAAGADCLPQTLRPLARDGRRIVHVLVEQHSDPAAAAALPLASLRAIPNLHVFRPACAVETAECWELALQRDDGPSVLIQSALPMQRWREEGTENACARGGYVAAGLYDARAATLIASGAELPVALEARSLLADAGISVAVVSLPCWSLFANQNEAYRADVLGDAPRLGVEAGSDFGWGRWLGAQGQFIGAASLGAMAARPGEYFRVTAEALVIAVRKKL
ncbi:MAG: transketolase [Proteobacteria bacterium]|nr:transketolase [Pseudomonadota bacterium]